MIGGTQSTTPQDTAARNAGALLLAAGGVAAAFGAASCCALPLLPGSLGLGSTWLLTVAWLAAPHRLALLAVAVVSLATGALLFLRGRRMRRSCGTGACGSPATTAAVAALLSLGAVLVVLGWMYA
jgi:mercuric ion transport protein